MQTPADRFEVKFVCSYIDYNIKSFWMVYHARDLIDLLLRKRCAVYYYDEIENIGGALCNQDNQRVR